MRIAILVWGSLYWDPRNLETTGEWFYDGPSLPLEFARISEDNRLTLVIKPNFHNVTTLYAISSHQNFVNARENLRIRENTPNIDNIGYIDFVNNTHHVRQSNTFIIEILALWNEKKGFEAILWSDFSPRFSDAVGIPFTLENVISFIEGLPNSEKAGALNYIIQAPTQISTRFRSSIERHFQFYQRNI